MAGASGRRLLLATAVVIVVFLLYFFVSNISSSHISVENISYTSTSKAMAVYATIRNTGFSTACIIGVEVVEPGSLSASLHETVEEGGVVSMRKIDRICLGPFETVDLAPGGLHIMIMPVGGVDIGDVIERYNMIRLRLILDGMEPIEFNVYLR